MLPTHSLLIPAVLALVGSAFAGQLVAVDSARVLYDLDITTGVRTPIGNVTVNAGTTGGLARDPAAGIVYLSSTSNDSLFTLDISTGTATLVGGYGTSTVVMHGIEWDSSTSTLYGGSNGDLFTIDILTGIATQLAPSGLTSFTNLGYDSTNDVLYATNSITDSLYTVDRMTGAMTLIGPLGPASTAPQGLAYDPIADIMYLVDNSTDNLCTIDRSTGAATLIGFMGAGNILGVVWLPDPPTPSTPFCFGDGTGTACPCGNTGVAGNGCANSVDPNGGNLSTSGSSSILGDSLVLLGTGMPTSSALYFQGTSELNGGAGSVFGDGLRCAGGTIIRLGTKANVAGASQYPDVGDATVSVRGLCASGDVRSYQVWYRNAAAFCSVSTFNLTNGVTLSWAP
jgi:hypothetical protein